jgi:hypothetical protein
MENRESNPPPLRRHIIDVLRRARKLPIGRTRNDLRQLAVGLRNLEEKDLGATVQSRLAAPESLKSNRFSEPDQIGVL